MINGVNGFLSLIWHNFVEFWNVDFDQVRYSDTGLAVGFGILLLAAVLLRIVLDVAVRKSASRKDSGHCVNTRNREGVFPKIRRAVPKFLILSVTVLILAALREPFMNQIRETEEITEPHVLIEMKDTSTSMAESYAETQEVKAKVALEKHMGFRKMRQGKKDRVSLWTFASAPHLIQEFVTDDGELYFLQVYDAPWLTYRYCPHARVPPERCAKFQGDEGGTDIAGALKAIIKFIDGDEYARKASRIALLIITDAEVYSFPEDELKQLRARNVVVYIILIASQSQWNDEGDAVTPAIPEFAKQIGRFGGKYFDARNENSLQRAFEEIDKIEKVQMGIKKYSLKIELFQIFLSAALLFVFSAIFIGLLVEIFWPLDP